MVVSATLRPRSPSLGAGGGSIVAVGAAGDIHVGPDSAGAVPGPACYGAAARSRRSPTPPLSDLSRRTASSAARAGSALPARGGFERLDTPAAAPNGFIGFNMASTTSPKECRHHRPRGIDPRDFSLVAYGAAGPMLLPC